MSYGSNLSDEFRQAGNYAGRILKGTKPGELPIIMSDKFEFVINLRAAKALGVAVPQALQAIATRWSNRDADWCGAWVRFWHFAAVRDVRSNVGDRG